MCVRLVSIEWCQVSDVCRIKSVVCVASSVSHQVILESCESCQMSCVCGGYVCVLRVPHVCVEGMYVCCVCHIQVPHQGVTSSESCVKSPVCALW